MPTQTIASQVGEKGVDIANQGSDTRSDRFSNNVQSHLDPRRPNQ
jgi:hypothetical protein